MGTKQNFCTKCGTPLEESTHFCPACGTKVLDIEKSNKKSSIHDSQFENSTTPSSSKSNQQSKFKLWITIPTVTITVFLIYSLFVIFQTGGNLLPSVTAVTFSPNDNNKLVSVANDNHLEIWDITQGKSIKRKKFASTYGIHRALAWDQGKHIIALSRVNLGPLANEIILYDSQTLNKISSLSTGANIPIALCIDSYDNTLYSVTDHLGMSVWDITKGKRLGGLDNLPYRFVSSAAFDNDCNKIATMEGTTTTKNGLDTTNKKLIVYNRINMETLFEKTYDDMYTDQNIVALSFNGKSVSTFTDYGNKLQTLDITTYKRSETVVERLISIQSIAMSKNNWFASGQSGGHINVFNNDGQHIKTLQHGPSLGIVLEPVLNYFNY